MARSIQRSRKTQHAECEQSPIQECEYPPDAALEELMPCDYSQPPYTKDDPVNSVRDTALFYSIYEIMLDLELPKGLEKAKFWLYFEECEYCTNMVRKDIHICPCWEKAIEIGDGYEADVEVSPVRGDMEPPSTRVIIDLTGDDSD
jgi:hypothetical protein